MIPVTGLFEAHLTVTDLRRSMGFYGRLLGLPLAKVFTDRKVAFYWIGSPGNSMLGIWETGSAPQRMSLHVAFRIDLPFLIDAPARLHGAGITPLDLWDQPAHEPVVLAWMPAAAVYFRDPDGNLMELVSMLADPPCPDLGIVSWSEWLDASGDSPSSTQRAEFDHRRSNRHGSTISLDPSPAKE